MITYMYRVYFYPFHVDIWFDSWLFLCIMCLASNWMHLHGCIMCVSHYVCAFMYEVNLNWHKVLLTSYHLCQFYTSRYRGEALISPQVTECISFNYHFWVTRFILFISSIFLYCGEADIIAVKGSTSWNENI